MKPMEPNLNKSEQDEQIDFLREQIKQRPINKQKLLRRTIITVGLAVLFGLVACLVFLIFLPLINNRLNPEPEPETIIFPAENAEEMQPEEMVALDAEIAEDDTTEDAQDSSAFEQQMEQYAFSTRDYESLQSSLKQIAAQALQATVTVTGTTAASDWLNDPYIRRGESTGLIVADNRVETLILADATAVSGADHVTVTFPDGSFYDAELKMRDNVSGLCVVAVENSVLSDATKESFHIAELGSSVYMSYTGMPVIAIGAPTGERGSVCYGNVTSENGTVDLTDSAFHLVKTDIYAARTASGVLVDLKGRVVGWITMRFNASDNSNRLTAIGITELKPLIGRLGNGEERARLGVHGVQVPADIKKAENIPDGAYITSIDMDSPAMQVGIQSGDIITALHGVPVSDYAALCSLLLDRRAGDTLRLTVLRQSGTTYREMHIEVTLTGTGA